MPNDQKLIDFRNHIRTRPGMYIGGKDIKSLNYMVQHVIKNSLDALISGKCDHLTITLLDKNTISIADNGAGIPITNYMDLDVSLLEIVLTRSGYFNRETGQYISALIGMQLAPINVLSAFFKVQIKRDGHLWEQIYHYGEQQGDLLKIRPLQENESTGTTITFTPDFSILEPNEFNYSMLAQRLRELAVLTKGLTVTLLDERSQAEKPATHFYYPNGLAEFVEYLNRDYTPLHQVTYHQNTFEIKPEHRPPYSIEIAFAFQYIQENASIELSYANTTYTHGSGTHVEGFRSALDNIIGRYDIEKGFGKYYCHDFVESDLTNGLTAVVAIKHPDVHLSSQFRPELVNPEVKDVVHKVVLETLEAFANAHPDEMRRMVERCLTNRDLREKRRG